MSERLRSERGWTVVTAMMVTGVMLGIGLATFSLVGGQQNQSGDERIGESSFNLGEGALSAQAFVLSSQWPGTPIGAYPEACAPGSLEEGCPDEDALATGFDSTDYAAETTWTTQVRDDAPNGTVCVPNALEPEADPYYTDSVLATNPTWDANCNRELWVRSEALVRGERRALVAKVEVEQMTEQFPRNLATAGNLHTGNSGNKVIADRQGGDVAPVPLAVRCTEGEDDCVDLFREGQISPSGGVEYGYPSETAASPGAIDRLRNRARSVGTYFEGCPRTLPDDDTLAATRIVFIEGTAAMNCRFTGNRSIFSAAAPGLLVVAQGKLELAGTTDFYGLIYAANLQGSADPDVVELQGCTHVFGAIAVDGAGGVTAGQCGSNKTDKVPNLVWDPTVFNDPIALTSYGSVGVVKNTFRELSG